jgi:hypothetical protein
MWTIEKFKEVYNRYEASGLPAKEFCMNEQLTRSRFYYWLKKYRKLEKVNVSIIKPQSEICNSHISPCFIPLPIRVEQQSRTYPEKETQKKSAVPLSSTPESFMEICYPSGTTVRLWGEKDMELVKTLILLSR